MKRTNKYPEYTDKDWAKLASILSDETTEENDLLSRFRADDGFDTIKNWKEIQKMSNDKEIDVDKAWNKLFNRLNDNGLMEKPAPGKRIFYNSYFLRVAAGLLVLISLSAAAYLIFNRNIVDSRIVVSTEMNQKNLQVTLPDGSIVYLNRNTSIAYNKNPGKDERKVTLTGEAFFDITPDPENPFVVDAGKANITVMGTSFNVISSNSGEAVEVFVQTGKVILSDNSGNESIELDPGFIGTMKNNVSLKVLNDDPNYLAWNTGKLFYDGQTLETVFNDLKKVYNMDIIADDPEILLKTWTSPIDNQPQETIIRLICTSFNLNFTKVDNTYHLSAIK